MTPTPDIAHLALALERRQEEGLRLFKRLQGDIKNKRNLRRYAACMRLCHLIQRRIVLSSLS